MKFTFSALCVLASIVCFAQDKFSAGFYVDKNKDTVGGFIQRKTNYLDKFLFRTQLKSNTIEVSLDQVEIFTFSSGTNYQRIQLKDDNQKTYSGFARSLFRGTSNLYAYQGRFAVGFENEYFLLKKDKQSEEVEALANYQANVGIFNRMLKDCPSLQKEASATPISEEGLIQLFESHNKCMGHSYQKFDDKQKGRVNQFGFFLGMSSSNLTFGSTKIYLQESKYSAYESPSFGAMLLFNGRSPSSISSMQSELIYSQAKFNATSIQENSFAGYDVKQTSITTVDYQRLTMRTGFRLTGRSNVINPYFSFGVSYTFDLSLDAHLNQTTQINSSTEVVDSQFLESTKSFGGWGGVGLKKRISKLQAFFVDVNYQSDFISYSGKITVLTSRLGFIF